MNVIFNKNEYCVCLFIHLGLLAMTIVEGPSCTADCREFIGPNCSNKDEDGLLI
jgi:hypothetical protein